jgi:hypothetical protein
VEEDVEIDRGDMSNAGKAYRRVRYCLDHLEKAQNFKSGFSMETQVVSALTLEEILGALVSAEIDLRTRES